MFSYYGSKQAIVDSYPIPICDRIIEPFAGSAAYSLRYFGLDVWINDLNPIIYEIWNWLINYATVTDIQCWPDELDRGFDIRTLSQLTRPERSILGFAINQCSVEPKNIVTEWAHRDNTPLRTKKHCLYFVRRIKHWRVTNLSYANFKLNPVATWFVDPPYNNHAGRGYLGGADINYARLASWCKSRRGQVVVCEQDGSTWLPFKFLRNNSSASFKKSKEAIWVQERC